MNSENTFDVIERLGLNSSQNGDFIEVTRSNDEGRLPGTFVAQLLEIKYLSSKVTWLDMIMGTDTGKGQRVSSNTLHISKVRKLDAGELLDRLNKISWEV
ncbi:MAG: hypothetical protein HY226_01235 [Candidatus Vogelbacteria bacterium]|nr:hypothetical protein [Candidatus Vogelbacteria bacterium]